MATTEGVRVFTRKSSGLVRQVSVLDTAYYTLILISVGIFFLLLLFWGLYPGSSMELATAYALLGALASGIVYGLYSSIYPRSGSEYVFLSRSAHPALGFATSFSMAFWLSQTVGLAGYLITTIMLAPVVLALGLQIHSQAVTSVGSFIGSSWGIFTVGLAAITLVFVLLLRGMGIYFRLQRWVFVLLWISLAITIVVLGLGAAGVLNFSHNLDAVTSSGAYAKTITDGIAAGAAPHAPFSLSATAQFAIWPAELLIFGVLSGSFAGEVKNPARTMLFGIAIGTIAAGIIVFVLEITSRGAFGDDFIQSVSVLGADKLPLADATVPVLTSVLGGNPILTVLMGLWSFLAQVLLCGGCIVYASRAILAWGIDGTAPDVLASVSDRYHTPTWALVAVYVLGVLSLIIFAFTTLFTFLTGFVAQAFVFLLVSLFGMLFPYIHRDAYQASAAKIEVLGIPLMTIAGAIGTLFLAGVVYSGITDNRAGANTPSTLWLTVIVFAVGFVWFYAIRWFRSRRGVNLDLRFKEIPVE